MLKINIMNIYLCTSEIKKSGFLCGMQIYIFQLKKNKLNFPKGHEKDSVI